MVTRRSKKYLRFVHQSAEGLRVEYSVSVTLKIGSHATGHLGSLATLARGRKASVYRQHIQFVFNKNITRASEIFHITSPSILLVLYKIREKIEIYFFYDKFLRNFYIFYFSHKWGLFILGILPQKTAP
jgi:hypothetical protein